MDCPHIKPILYLWYEILRHCHYEVDVHGSENKQRLYPYTALAEWFL